MFKEDAAMHPIIYVRGYAMSQGEIDDTTADPFCGFNLGSTVFRATPEKTRARKFIFESPVVRLASDFGYRDVFAEGYDILDSEWSGTLPKKSIIIYRYYDPASSLLGGGETPKIEEFAKGLSKLIARVRELVCDNPENETPAGKFRCYLVAHSMGGLVCRAFLQNPELDEAKARSCVDKVFTFATPHNGIDMAGINVPEWLSVDDINNFNRDRMAGYLNLRKRYEETLRVDWLPEESFPSEKVFCLIGTNRSDYEVAKGLSRTFAGHGGDGLVRIENAWVCGVQAEGKESVPTAKAFVYRSHSGYFGIVNSEESYQNLVRFLFGDIRVDIWLDVEDIRLPEDIQKEAESGKKIGALYQFEVLASPRGKLWYLTRRVAEEDSVACLAHDDWLKAAKPCKLYLSTIFLAKRARVNKARPSLAYSMTLGVRVPDYEVERKLWIDEHYEGGYLFRDAVVIELVPPETEDGDWEVKYDWQSDNIGQASQALPAKELNNGKVELTIDFGSDTSPGIRGKLRFVVSRWNAAAADK
ncbi:MAG TPA: hypothetical protein VE616_16170 [Candidatus Udaeobacter sp.]|nr:hypothetical protein [Candidatus Udaeobacter sp.]